MKIDTNKLSKELEQALKKGQAQTKEGKVATYIPELSKVDGSLCGIAVVTMDGQVFTSGDADHLFTIQSVSKPIALMLALMERGEEYVFSKVGMEPTGDPFNSILRLETFDKKKPLNPMINAGAIAIDSVLEGVEVDKKFKHLLDFTRKLAHNDTIMYSKETYESERDTGFRNFSLAYYMKDNGIIEGDVSQTLEIYFKQCSIMVNCRDIAMIGAVLANNGVSPLTGEQLVPISIVRIAKTFMMTCGMYDASGEMAIRVGIPSKSGVGGGVMATVPNKLGIGTFGPALDGKGNSCAGTVMLEHLSNQLNLSIFG